MFAITLASTSKACNHSIRKMIAIKSNIYESNLKKIKLKSSLIIWSLLTPLLLKTKNLFVIKAKATDNIHANDAAIL